MLSYKDMVVELVNEQVQEEWGRLPNRDRYNKERWVAKWIRENCDSKPYSIGYVLCQCGRTWKSSYGLGICTRLGHSQPFKNRIALAAAQRESRKRIRHLEIKGHEYRGGGSRERCLTCLSIDGRERWLKLQS